MNIVTFPHIDMREIYKVRSLTLRSSIIVHKLEILPKLVGFLSLFQHHPLRSQKKQTAREWKRSHLWDVLYTEHIFCHQSECFELLDAIKALDNDCWRLYRLLLFLQRHGAHPSLSAFNWNHFLRYVLTPHHSLLWALQRCSKAAPMLKGSDLWGDPQPEKTAFMERL